VTRVVAGAARGRRLAVPAGTTTRPTSDRAREGLFSTLESVLGTLAGRSFLDLFAGSGAIGLEALSRGAAHVLLVENERRAHAVVAGNVTAVGLAGAVVSAAPVERLVAESPVHGGYDVAVLDPPYSMPATRVAAVVSDLAANGWLLPGAIVVVERATRDGGWAWPASLAADRSRRYGEATLWYGRAAGGSDGPEPGPQA
jgi:16S rRNA (guanine966-N2)-methyltransferase